MVFCVKHHRYHNLLRSGIGLGIRTPSPIFTTNQACPGSSIRNPMQQPGVLVDWVQCATHPTQVPQIHHSNFLLDLEDPLRPDFSLIYFTIVTRNVLPFLYDTCTWLLYPLPRGFPPLQGNLAEDWCFCRTTNVQVYEFLPATDYWHMLKEVSQRQLPRFQQESYVAHHGST